MTEREREQYIGELKDTRRRIISERDFLQRMLDRNKESEQAINRTIQQMGNESNPDMANPVNTQMTMPEEIKCLSGAKEKSLTKPLSEIQPLPYQQA
jgi:hypothetical protein